MISSISIPKWLRNIVQQCASILREWESGEASNSILQPSSVLQPASDRKWEWSEDARHPQTSHTTIKISSTATYCWLQEQWHLCLKCTLCWGLDWFDLNLNFNSSGTIYWNPFPVSGSCCRRLLGSLRLLFSTMQIQRQSNEILKHTWKRQKHENTHLGEHDSDGLHWLVWTCERHHWDYDYGDHCVLCWVELWDIVDNGPSLGSRKSMLSCEELWDGGDWWSICVETLELWGTVNSAVELWWGTVVYLWDRARSLLPEVSLHCAARAPLLLLTNITKQISDQFYQQRKWKRTYGGFSKMAWHACSYSDNRYEPHIATTCSDKIGVCRQAYIPPLFRWHVSFTAS